MSIPADTLARLKAYQLRMIERLKMAGGLSAPKPRFVDLPNEPDSLILRQLETLRENRAEDRSAAPGIERPGRASEKTEPPIPEAEILNDLTDNPAKPAYLLLARAGTGKSVLLESFARAMNAKLGISLAKGEVSAVPLLIRLRDFNAEETAPGIKKMLESAEDRIFGIYGDDDRPILRPTDLEHLACAGLLIPMFDGFDEFVHRDHFVTALKSARSNASLLQHCSFAVTSRLDADYRMLPIDPKFRREIKPLTETQVKTYVVTQRGINATHLENAPASIRRLLTQPLYLCIWCNCINQPGGKAPRTLDELMLELFTDYLERRGRLATIADCERGQCTLRERQKKQWAQRELYARVCGKLAKAGFGEPVPINDLTGLSEAEIDEITSLKDRVGLIELLRQGREVYINQIPVVEYLVGWDMAQAFTAAADPARRREAIDQFASWVWRPAMHEVLDYCFDALWNSKDAEQEKIAAELIGWLVDVSDQYLATNKRPNQEKNPRDDLLRPFCASALRWMNLKVGLKPNDSVLAKVYQALAKIVWRGASQSEIDFQLCSKPVQGVVPLLRWELLKGLINAYIDTAVQQGNDIIRWQLCLMIRDALGRVAEGHALECVRELLDAARQPENAGICSQLGSAILDAAMRVAEGPALEYVKVLLNAATQLENAGIRWELGGAILYAAGRVAEGHALECVRELLDAARQPQNVGIREELGGAIRGAAERVAEGHALECVRELLDTARQPQNAGIREELGGAIKGAAKRVAEGQALGCVRAWLDGARQPQNAGIREELGGATEGSAKRVVEGQALECVRAWLDGARQPQNADIRVELGRAIRGAAGRVVEGQALECVRELLDAARHPQNAGIREELGGATEGAAERVVQGRALECVREWLDAARQPQNAGIREELGRAIRGAARRVAEGQARKCVQVLLNAVDKPENADIHKELCEVIKGAAARVAEGHALECVRELLDAARQPQNADIRGELGWVTEGAAKRVAEDQALECVKALLRQPEDADNLAIRCAGGRIPANQHLEAANWALDAGENVLAFEIAGSGTIAAIVSDWGKLPPPAQEMGLVFKAVARADMKLAMDSSAVPKAVKEWMRQQPKEKPRSKTPEFDEALIDTKWFHQQRIRDDHFADAFKDAMSVGRLFEREGVVGHLHGKKKYFHIDDILRMKAKYQWEQDEADRRADDREARDEAADPDDDD